MADRDRRLTCNDVGRKADAPLPVADLAYGFELRLSEIERHGKQCTKNKRVGPIWHQAGSGWDIVVLGKRGKLRTVPIPNAVINALAAYSEIIWQGRVVGAWPEGHVIFQTLAMPRDGSRRARTMRCSRCPSLRCIETQKALQDCCMLDGDARRCRALIQPERNGYAIPIPPMRWRQGAEIVEVQENLGHCSETITAIYTHASRKSVVEKLMAFAELSNLTHSHH